MDQDLGFSGNPQQFNANADCVLSFNYCTAAHLRSAACSGRKIFRQKSDNLVLGATGANKDFTACFRALVPDGGREALCLLLVKITGLAPPVFEVKADSRAPFKQQ